MSEVDHGGAEVAGHVRKPTPVLLGPRPELVLDGQEAALGILFDPRHQLLAMRVTQPNATALRSHAIRELSHHHGNQFVQRSLRPEGFYAPPTQLGRIDRQPSVLARDDDDSGGGTTTFNALVRSSYPVAGRTLAAALQSIEAYARAHDGEAGSVTWRPRWTLTRGDDGYVTAATVTITIRKTMPSWPNASRLSTAARAEWNRAYGELDAHEDQHVELIRTNAADMADVAIGLTEADANAALSGQVEIVNNANAAIDPFVTVLTTNIP